MFHPQTTSPGHCWAGLMVGGCRTREQQGERWHKAEHHLFTHYLVGTVFLLTPGCPRTGSRGLAGINHPIQQVPHPHLQQICPLNRARPHSFGFNRSYILSEFIQWLPSYSPTSHLLDSSDLHRFCQNNSPLFRNHLWAPISPQKLCNLFNMSF